ncbi:MAG TPA: hypothetical protein VK179_18885, partial [Bacteroidales bacterium]|nr:hypothetical protein [Bacteroidales bacterium]
MKKQVLILIAFALLCLGRVAAQNITATTYTFARSGFSPTSISAPDTLVPSNSDDVASQVTDIGFTFWFAGTPYTQFSVNENGLMTLGDVQISGTDHVNDMTSNLTLPKIAPYWDDLATGTNGNVVYKVTGTAPNRILVINWNVTVPKNTANAANAIIQVQLSETSGNISFTYGWPALPANAGQYSIGIGASTTDFASVTVTGTGATATCAYGTANNSNTLSIAGYSRFSFTTDRTAPTISGVVIPNTGGTANRTCTRTIADAKTGVPLTGDYIPRIYFKKSTQTEWVSTPGVFQSGTAASSSWLFTVDHDLLGGVTPGDYVQYYVIAQDNSTTVGVPNISSLPAGVSATNVNTIISPPASPSSYIIGAIFSGTKTVGEGGDYTSFTNTGGLFEQLNAGVVEGNVTVNVISDITNETGTNALNEFAAPYTLTIYPVGLRTINATSGNAVFRYNGADRVTINGLNDGTNSLTVINTAGNVASFAAGASDNVITNATLKGITSSTGGVVQFGDCSNTASNSNNSINHCTITTSSLTISPYAGVYLSKFSGTAVCTGNIIDNNIITGFGQRGIHDDRGYVNSTYSNNDISQTITNTYGIGIIIAGTGAHGTINIFKNKIHNLAVSSNINQYSAGIQYSTGLATDILNIYNNEVSFETESTNPTADKIYGIQVGGPGTSNVYYNSIYIGGSNVTSGNTVGFFKAGGTVNLKNNVISNVRSNTSYSIYYNHFALAVNSLTGFTSNFNDLYVSGTSSYLANIGISLGYSQGIDYATLANWQTISSMDGNSLSADPLFTSLTNFFPLNNSLNAGTPIAGITTDITGATRDAVTPTIGAYEVPCTNPSTGGEIAANVTTGCNPFDPDMITSTSLPSGNSGTLEYMWMQSTVSSTTGFTEIANSNSETYDPGALTVNTWFKRLARVECKGTWTDAAVSNVIGFTVTSQPVSVTIAESSNNVCAGTQVTFTPVPVNGGTAPSYQWYKNGTPVSTGATYTYVPLNNDQVYVVLTSSLEPCATGVTATSNTITMAVNPLIPVSATIFASANNVCDGTAVSYFALVTNGGTAPVYQWKVNGSNVGTNVNNYTYTPSNNDVVTCSIIPDVICPSVNPVVSNSVTMTVYSTLVPEVSIAATSTVVCEGTEITFTATPVNGTSSPVYHWYKNGISTGTNSPSLTGVFANGDAVYVTLTVSPNPCIPSNTVTSNTITLTVNPMPVLVITNPAQVTIPATADLTAPAVTAGSTSGLDLTYWKDAAATIPCATPTAVTVGTYYIKGLNTTTGCYNIQPVHVTGLISYWHFDEANGPVYTDAAGFNNGTGNIAPTAVQGRVNTAQHFNGTSTKIDVPANPTFDFLANGDFSFECWYKGTASSKMLIGRY